MKNVFYKALIITIISSIANFATASRKALQFNGTSQYVTFGAATSTLGSSTFTLECWIKRTGAGVPASAGSGGAYAVPVITKGSGEDDVPPNINCNYFLGINTGGKLVADFEDKATGLNHVINGVASLSLNIWYHIAATYDGTTWRLYINGIQDAFLIVGAFLPENTSIQHAGLATSMSSTGVASGFFAGIIDEARIWNIARTQAEIQASMNLEVISGAGLIGRWGLNDGTGISAANSVAGSPAGTLVNSPSWVATPDDPSNLVVTPISNSVLELTWTDNSANETGFEIERSSSGSGGPFALFASVGPGITTFDNTGLTSLASYCYRVRATNGVGQSAYTSVACGATLVNANSAIDLGSSGAFITFGIAPGIATPTFTIETWFKRTGTGVAYTTGTGGIDIIPLISKGADEAEGSTADANYILGIQSGTGLLAADFEEGTGSKSPGLNHPIVGTTVITDNVWHHAAATFANGIFSIYLDGVMQGTPLSLETSIFPQGASIQHAALGTMLTSASLETPLGKFQGVLDEARIWNYARTIAEIRSTINSQIATTQTGLLARWGMNEGTGALVSSTAGTTVNGTISGTGYTWVPGAPFYLQNLPPNVPTLNAPVNNATGVSTAPILDVTPSDPEGGNLTVNFYGRPLAVSAGTFSLIVLPDAQFYTTPSSGGLPEMFTSQTQWCVNNKTIRNIKYVSQVGDITDDNSNSGWQNANASMSLLDATPPGIPYGIALGNHDYYKPPTNYGTYFPISRFAGRPYYGGALDANNENHYEFFSSNGLDFIVINLSCGNQIPTTAQLTWADGLLKTYSTRRAIVVSHFVIYAGNPALFSTQGQALYDALKNNPNLFLMLGGHEYGEGIRSDTYNGNTVYSLLADYQAEPYGGNGYLRILEFDPANNVIHVSSYSPYVNLYKTGSSVFDVPYPMNATSFKLIGTNSNVASGTGTTKSWPDLLPSTQYEWYSTVSDGTNTTASTIWKFTTGGGCVAPPTPIVGNITQPNCSLATGSVDLSGLPSGSWIINPVNRSGSGTNTTITGLAAGIYNFTVTSGTCTSSATANVEISSYVAITASASAGTILTTGGTTTLTVSASGGTPGYTYSLDNGVTYQPGNTFSVKAGTYTATVKDSRGCTKISNTITIKEPSLGKPTNLTLTFNTFSYPEGSQVKLSALLREANGNIVVKNRVISFTVGSQTITARTNGKGESSATLTLNQSPGSYQLVGTFAGDATYQKCSVEKPFTITAKLVAAALKSAKIISNAPIVQAVQLKVYPNPSSGSITFEFSIDEDAMASLDLYTEVGQKLDVVYYQYTEAGILQKVSYNKPLEPGLYVYTLRWNGQMLKGKLIFKP